MRKPQVGEGCFAITVINRDVQARGNRDVSVAFDNIYMPLFLRTSLREVMRI